MRKSLKAPFREELAPLRRQIQEWRETRSGPGQMVYWK